MHGVSFQSTRVEAWEELPDPGIEHPDDAVVAVEVAGLCGSDLHPFFGRETGLDPGTVMGHEFVGRVLDVGPGRAHGACRGPRVRTVLHQLRAVRALPVRADQPMRARAAVRVEE